MSPAHGTDTWEVLRRLLLNKSVSAQASLPCRLPKETTEVAARILSYKMSPPTSGMGAMAEAQSGAQYQPGSTLPLAGPGSQQARCGSSELRERPGGQVPRSTQPACDHVSHRCCFSMAPRSQKLDVEQHEKKGSDRHHGSYVTSDDVTPEKLFLNNMYVTHHTAFWFRGLDFCPRKSHKNPGNAP